MLRSASVAKPCTDSTLRLFATIFHEGCGLAVNLAVLDAWGLHRLRGSCHGLQHPEPAGGPAGLIERVGIGPEHKR